MKTIVEVFDPKQAESLGSREREGLVEKAIAHHARQLREIAELLQTIFERPESINPAEWIDSDNFLPTLRELIMERSEIINRLEDDYAAAQKEDREVIMTRLAAERSGLRTLPTRPRQRKAG